MFLNAVLPGVVLLGLVIFVHELGHFLAAKWRGVRVLRFSLGFGPAIFKVVRGETEYRLSWFPLGGYVQMAGDSPDEGGQMPTGAESYLSHPWHGRLIIAAAGPAANVVGAFVVLVVASFIGVKYPDFENRVGTTADTSYAHQLGARTGDRIVAIAGAPIRTWHGMELELAKIPTSQGLTVSFEREGQRVDVPLTAEQRRPFLRSLVPPSSPPVIGNVTTGMPAYKAGLREGDRIVAVNGRPITTWDELPVSLRGQVDKDVQLQVQRGQTQFGVTVRPINADGNTDNRGMIGIEAPRGLVYVERYGLLESIDVGFRTTVALIPAVYGQMWLTITRPIYYREYLGGPIFIAQAASEQARRGFDSWMQLMAFINIAIMAFNLLPLPLLDGGHIVLALLEAVRRHAISAKTYLRFQRAGLMFVGALFVFILANDFNRLFQRQRALNHGTRSAPQESPVAPSPP